MGGKVTIEFKAEEVTVSPAGVLRCDVVASGVDLLDIIGNLDVGDVLAYFDTAEVLAYYGVEE